MRRPELILGLAVLVGSVLGACGSAPAPRSTAEPDRAAAVFDLVTRSGGTYLADQYVLSGAEDALVATCMKAKGQRYVVPTSRPPDRTAARASLVVLRADRGYGLYEQYSTARDADTPVSVAGSNDRYVADLSGPRRARYLKALRGDPQQVGGLKLGDGREVTYPTQGCEAEARAQIYSDPTTAMQISYVPQIVDRALLESFSKNRRYTEALAQWRTCMAAAGEKYESPVAARAELERAYRTKGATAARQRQEVEVATEDRRCDDQAELSPAAVAAGQSYLQSLPAPDRTELQRLATARLAAVETARRIRNG